MRIRQLRRYCQHSYEADVSVKSFVSPLRQAGGIAAGARASDDCVMPRLSIVSVRCHLSPNTVNKKPDDDDLPRCRPDLLRPLSPGGRARHTTRPSCVIITRHIRIWFDSVSPVEGARGHTPRERVLRPGGRWQRLETSFVEATTTLLANLLPCR